MLTNKVHYVFQLKPVSAPTLPFRTLRCFLEVFLVLFVPSANCRLDKKAAKRLGGNQRKSQSNEHFLTTELVMSQKICLSAK